MIPLAALPLDTGAALRRAPGGLDRITRSIVAAHRLAVMAPPALAAMTLPPGVTTLALAGLNALQRAIGYRPDTLALPTFRTFPIGDEDDYDDDTARDA